LPKRARDRRTTSLDALQAKVAQLASTGRCRRLVHLFIPGSARPVSTPGFAECAELERQFDARDQYLVDNPEARPKPITPTFASGGHDTTEEDSL
jgi:hypothetical protein